MGTFTTNFKLYKPVPNEIVDVNQQLNYNWDVVDLNARKLMEYQYFTGPSVSDIVGTSNRKGERWYKTYSNSILGADGPGSFLQDNFAHVDTWINASSFITQVSGPSWQAYPSNEPHYRVISSSGTTTEIEWVGRVWIGGAQIQPVVNYTPVLTGLPAGIRPVVGKYFNLYAGNTTTDYASARCLADTAGNLQFMRYGNGAATASTENYIDLGGVRYNLEIAA